MLLFVYIKRKVLTIFKTAFHQRLLINTRSNLTISERLNIYLTFQNTPVARSIHGRNMFARPSALFPVVLCFFNFLENALDMNSLWTWQSVCDLKSWPNGSKSLSNGILESVFAFFDLSFLLIKRFDLLSLLLLNVILENRVIVSSSESLTW